MRKRDIREQRWQQERDDDLRDDDMPERDDEPASWERSMQ